MNKAIILISADVFQERLEDGVKDVKYLAKVSSEMSHSRQSANGARVGFSYEVFTLGAEDAENITNEEFDNGEFGLLGKGGTKNGQFELRGFEPDIEFTDMDIEEIQVKLNELYFLSYCNSKAIYGINNWQILE